MIQYRRIPGNRKLYWGFLVFYQANKDGSPVLKEQARWWKINGFVINGVHEIVFRRHGRLGRSK